MCGEDEIRGGAARAGAAELRELLAAVAGELERMAAAGETDARPLLARAMRIRARLHAA